MRTEQLRASLQLGFLLFAMPLLFAFGVGCRCGCGVPSEGAGGDYIWWGPAASIGTRDILVANSTVARSHYLQDGFLSATAGETQAAQAALPASFIGIRIPSDPASGQQGRLLDGVQLRYDTPDTSQAIDFREDKTNSAVLNEQVPPAPGTRWVALVPTDLQLVNRLLSGPLDVTGAFASFTYSIDFGANGACNGCNVQLIACGPSSFAALLPPALAAAAQTTEISTLACSPPVDTYITLFDGNGDPLPDAPLVAAFGFWGSQATTATVDGTAVIPVTLQHTGATNQTFDLQSIESAMGWTYRWEDAQRRPITQIEVPPSSSFGMASPNLYVTADGLPTCTQVLDVLNLVATDTLTPSVQAYTPAYIQVLPDPALCPEADVAAIHRQWIGEIAGGDSITYTLTVSNVTSSATGAVIQQTITPASAVRGAILPNGCTRSGNVVTCQMGQVPANGAKSAIIVIQSRFSYAGDVLSSVKASPLQAADAAFVDNVHGPLSVTVQASGKADGLYLPFITRKR